MVTKARPRVADLIPRLQLRGAEVFAQHLEVALADRFEILLLPLLDRPTERAPGLEPEGASIPYSPGAADRLGRPFRAAWSLRKRVRAFRPDLIVAHGGGPLRVAVLAGLHRTAPIIYIRVAAVTPELRTPARLASLNAAYRRVTAFVAVSESLRRELVDDFGVAEDRIVVIRNGRRAPPALSREERGAIRAELGVAEDEVLATWVGQLVPEKDPVGAVEVARRLAERAAGVRMVLVGVGPLEAEVRQAAASVASLVLVGRRHDAPRIIAASDLVVSTSRTEGAPGVLIEAALGGVAVACYDLGGIRDIVVPDETGVLVPPGDAEALAGAVADLARDPQLRTRLGDRAREWGKRFEINAVAEEYARLYRSVLNGGSSAPQR